MADFKFDPVQSFSTNLENFLANVEETDADMAAILRDNIEILKSVVIDGERNTQSRSEFNNQVKEALELLLLKDEKVSD